MLKKILIGLAAIVGLCLIYAAVAPADYKISRSIVINAPADEIFPYVNNTQKVNDWMPWADSDPGLKMEVSGPAEGVGAVSSWKSEGQMGEGKATVIESVSNQMVKTQIETFKPMVMNQISEMTLVPQESGTQVTWTVIGKNEYIGRLMCLFINMDKMVGGEFEKGLSKLKAMVEK